MILLLRIHIEHSRNSNNNIYTVRDLVLTVDFMGQKMGTQDRHVWGGFQCLSSIFEPRLKVAKTWNVHRINLAVTNRWGWKRKRFNIAPTSSIRFAVCQCTCSTPCAARLPRIPATVRLKNLKISKVRIQLRLGLLYHYTLHIRLKKSTFLQWCFNVFFLGIMYQTISGWDISVQ